MAACPKCATDHEGYPAGSLGAELRCLRTRAAALDAPSLVAALDTVEARLASERDSVLARYRAS